MNLKVDRFNQLFLKVLNNHAPFKQIKIKGRARRFINKDIKQLMNQRDRKLNMVKLLHRIEDWEVYQGLRNSVKASLRNIEI